MCSHWPYVITRQVQHVIAYSCIATFTNGSKATCFFHRENPVSGLCLFHLRFSRSQPYHLGNMASRKWRSSASKTASSASLPDLTLNMSLSAIRQLPVAAFKQYAQLYQLSSDGNKQTLTQRLHAHLNTDESHSDEPGKSDSQRWGSQNEYSNKDGGTSQPSSSSSSPEGEYTPSRQRRNPRSLNKHHSRRKRLPKSTITIPNAAKHSRHHPTTLQQYMDVPNDANKGPTV